MWRGAVWIRSMLQEVYEDIAEIARELIPPRSVAGVGVGSALEHGEWFATERVYLAVHVLLNIGDLLHKVHHAMSACQMYWTCVGGDFCVGAEQRRAVAAEQSGNLLVTFS